jgi:hypothetical protein
MPEYTWRPLGELLIERGLIDRYDLEAALTEQRLSGRLLGELLVAKRLVSPNAMAAALAAQHGVHLDSSDAPTREPRMAGETDQKWKPLGRLLVERDLLTESGLQRALIAQRRSGGSLGEILVKRRYITPAQLAEVLADQHGLDVEQRLLDEARELLERPEVVKRFEVREPGANAAVFTSSSYLDATDFAFELLDAEDPDALEIVELGDTDTVVWSYSRTASEAARSDRSAA